MKDPWITSEDAFPKSGTEADQLRFFVNYAVLAPSGHNTQPWLFRVGRTHLDLFADSSRSLPTVDAHDRELTISCGAALEHLGIAARYFGCKVAVNEFPEPLDADLVARIRLAGRANPTPHDRALFRAIQRRRTTRQAYDARPLPQRLRQACVAAAAEWGVELMLVSEQNHRALIADLVAVGDRLQFANEHFRRELAAWVRSRRTARRDGVSAEGFGLPDVLSPMGAAVIRRLDIGGSVAAIDRAKVMDSSPVLAAFSTSGDRPRDWLRTGRALSRVLLTLTASDATAAYLNQPIEVEQLRPRLRELLALGGTPQLLLRFGYGPRVRSAARRPLTDVLC